MIRPVPDPFDLRSRGIRDPRVLAAMASVPRERFIPAALRDEALADHPLPIGHGQTISQPFIVAWMTEALELEKHHRVLEVGTGSGYQTAILAELAGDVWSVEIEPALHARAEATLARLGYGRVHLALADGYRGWPEAAPFDRVILTAAPADVPPTLVDQLGDGGRLVAPVGTDDQVIVILSRRGSEVRRETALAVRFVPMRHPTQDTP
jgi:protein-L-isoaspartate(D-aspartate) O-methyltransferase